MLINKMLHIFLLFFYVIFYSQGLFAGQIKGQDKVIFNQAEIALKQNNWQLAKSLLSPLHHDFPENIVVSNNLAVALFNLGELEKSQQLFASVLEKNKQTRNSYENLKKLYSYSAAKTYSTGLKLYKPINLPNMRVLNEKFDIIESHQILSSSHQKKVPKTIIIASKETKPNLKPLQDSKIKNNQTALSITNKDNTNTAVLKEVTEVKNILVVKKEQENKPSIKKEPKLKIKAELKESDKAILLASLEKWRKSWVSGDVEKYISMYQKNYSPRGKTRNAWVKNRQQKVVKSKKIKVEIKNAQVYINDSQTKANIRFDQNYSSSNYTDGVLKRLYWIKIKGQWYINRESIIKTL
jgi:tetratricopeptide (TPR) repeat protein